MKPGVTTANRMAAFRMLPRCNAHFIGSQFYYLVLLLAISSLPLAGTKPQLAQILGPFGTEPVPLGTGLQIPPGNSLPLPSLLTSERLVLGPCPSPALGPVFHSNCRLCHISSGFREHAAIDRPSGRSPPCFAQSPKHTRVPAMPRVPRPRLV